MYIFGIIGIVLISYAIWVKKELHQDLLFLISGVSLLLYSIYIEDPIFILLQAVYILSVSLEIFKLKRKK